MIDLCKLMFTLKKSNKLSEFLNRKMVIGLVFLGFSIFWLWLGFLGAVFCIVVMPIIYFYAFKNDDNIEIFKNSDFISTVFILIILSYIGYMAQYISIPNTNKFIQNQSLTKETYQIQEYQSIRTRAGSELFVLGKKGAEVMVCTHIGAGRCPYYDKSGESIYIESIKPRRNFRQVVLRKEALSFVYYINYHGQIIDNSYFIEKYNQEYRDMFLFLLSLNLYMIFIFYIKYIYNVQIVNSLISSFSSVENIIKSIFYIIFYLIYFFFFFI